MIYRHRRRKFSRGGGARIYTIYIYNNGVLFAYLSTPGRVGYICNQVAVVDTTTTGTSDLTQVRKKEGSNRLLWVVTMKLHLYR